jgi:hypothetical protein
VRSSRNRNRIKGIGKRQHRQENRETTCRQNPQRPLCAVVGQNARRFAHGWSEIAPWGEQPMNSRLYAYTLVSALVVCLVVVFTFAPASLAQTASAGALAGTVTDQFGGGATVTATNAIRPETTSTLLSRSARLRRHRILRGWFSSL